MDPKDLLQDLHFQLSCAGSAPSSELKLNQSFARHLRLDVEDKKQMIEMWIAQVQRRNRQRSLSSDSYFGSTSICEKLKKSFLKPCTVQEDDLEELRVRISKIKLEDNEKDLEEFRDRLSRTEIEESESVISELSQPNPVSLNSEPFVPSRLKSKELSRTPQRYRSKTVPLYHFTNGVDHGNIGPIGVNDKHNDSPMQDVSSIHTVDLIKDILLDENRNVVLPQTPPVCLATHEATLKQINLPKFRSENIIPNAVELKEEPGEFQCSPNRIVGHYDNAEDYLGTQFNLMKEDFLRPLREGIADYKRQSQLRVPYEVKNLKLHHDVTILEPCIERDRLGITIDMGFPLSERIGDKDFMEGSFVLLTDNNFEDILVGLVVDRKFSLATGGIIRVGRRRSRRMSNKLIVELHNSSHFDPSLMQRKMLLVESSAFFAPYYYVMKIFQNMAIGDLPMKPFIIGSNPPKVIGPPSYLSKNSEYVLNDHLKINVLKEDWMNSEVLNINESQLKAFKKSLSKELVLIQGPPGTGKTYLGSIIAKTLLLNRNVWNRMGNQPMLLMCQTNHALDQFMELLLPVTQKLVRVGCQSKSAVLGPFTMRAWLRRTRDKVDHHFVNQKIKLKSLSSSMAACKLELVKVSSHGILDLKTLVEMGIIKPCLTECFVSTEGFLLWLEEARHFQETNTSLRSAGNFQRGCPKHNPESNIILDESAERSCLRDMQILGKSLYRPSVVKDISINYILSLSDLEFALIKEEKRNESGNSVELKKQTKALRGTMEFFKKYLTVVKDTEISCGDVECLWNIAPSKRWCMYRSWVNKLKGEIQSHLEVLESQFILKSHYVADLKQKMKLDIMQQAEVVGMTSTAAARLYPILLELQCPIVIVEEAAEVFESHIVATATKHCQHLILLGDHKQLRPRPASHSLSKSHFTDVSLFERLLLNNTVSVNTLLTQHRMRPEISALIRPSIYPMLHDHECTTNRENIFGMRKNVFFFSHCWPESKDAVSGSYSNEHEAQMAVQLFRYFLKEKYSPNDICILTAYRQQVSLIQQNCSLYSELEGARVLTIDNFQGEESRIVILSLVRNNNRDQIGFLSVHNRVCVALSRARDGLFMLGNIDLLSRNSDLWASVHEVLHRNDSVGPHLPLFCARHPSNQILVSNAREFSEHIEFGVCQLTCLFKLSCGHLCKRKCHSYDSLHLQYICSEKCKKRCNFGHECTKRCSEDCGTCDNFANKRLECGHTAFTKCSLETNNYLCGVTVKKQMLPCLHWVSVQCWMASDSVKYCPYQCPKMLQCGHQCQMRCNSVKHPSHNEMKCWCNDTYHSHTESK